MRRNLSIVCLIAAFLLLPFAAAAQSQAGRHVSVTEGPAPEFVVRRDLPKSWSDILEGPNGARMVLVDLQHNAAGPESEIYARIVGEALTQKAAQALSFVQIALFPDHQSVEINSVRVRRNGEFEDRAGRYHVSFMTPENLALEGIVTGLTYAIVRLDDIRAGDLVDFAYTLRGASAALGDRNTQSFPTAMPAAVAQFSLRSLWAGDVKTSTPPPNVKLRRSTERGRTVISIEPSRYDAVDLAKSPSLANAVGASVIVSDYRDWAEVKAWAQPFYRNRPQEEVRQSVEELVRGLDSVDAQIVAILRFVQDEIRYSAVLLGEAGYKPASAGETLRARFGDCKAKAMLLMTMLDVIGVESEAALVSATNGFLLDLYPPTPNAFDHVVVGVKRDEGNIWVDPSISQRRGSLLTMARTDYGFALPLGEHGVGELTPMADRPVQGIAVEVTEAFDLVKGAGPATATLNAVYRIQAADTYRQTVEALGEGAYFDALLALYSRYGKAAINSRKVEDNAELNEIRLSMEVSISQPFGDEEKDGRRYFRHFPRNIPEPLPDFGEETPIGALALNAEGISIHRLEVILPKRILWKLAAEDLKLENKAFRIDAITRQEQDRLIQSTTLTPLARTVAPADYWAAIDDQSKMDDDLGYKIWMSADVGASDPGVGLEVEKPAFEMPDVRSTIVIEGDDGPK